MRKEMVPVGLIAALLFTLSAYGFDFTTTLKTEKATFLATTLDQEKLLTLLASQKDKVAFAAEVDRGRQAGTIVDVPAGTKFYLMRTIDSIYMEVRPSGSTQTFFGVKRQFKPNYGDMN